MTITTKNGVLSEGKKYIVTHRAQRLYVFCKYCGNTEIEFIGNTTPEQSLRIATRIKRKHKC